MRVLIALFALSLGASPALAQVTPNAADDALRQSNALAQQQMLLQQQLQETQRQQMAAQTAAQTELNLRALQAQREGVLSNDPVIARAAQVGATVDANDLRMGGIPSQALSDSNARVLSITPALR